ncbi:hypothetical protein ACFSSB_02110 [Lacinutrix gracilariae]|uniref:Right handed beta helix region n=1 Tax=Lacinutrix gracilariae TaxID=1747198 RepID=A0ABW5JXU3_9FLAO
MKTFTTKLKNTFILCFVLVSSSVLAQTIITVDNNPGSTTTHQTIQEAHDAATDGDIIYVQPSSSSYGNIIIDKELTIIGRSHSEPSKVSQLGTITIRSSNVTIKGLYISSLYASSSGAPNTPPYIGLNIFDSYFNSYLQLGTNSATVIQDDVTVRGCVLAGTNYIYEDATNVLLSNNIFKSNSPLRIYNTTSTVIANNVFKFTSSLSFTNYNTSGTAILYNNMFITNYASDATINFNNGDFNLSNNLTYNYGNGDILFANSTTGSYLESNTLANTDPLFTNVDNTVSNSFAGTSSYNPNSRLEDDLTLQATSPALTGGGGGSEMGLYNNGFLYNILGNARGIPTLDIISYDGAVPKNGTINVTINAKAH